MVKASRNATTEYLIGLGGDICFNTRAMYTVAPLPLRLTKLAMYMVGLQRSKPQIHTIEYIH